MTPTDPAAHHYSDAEMHNEDVAHEHSDINIRSVVAFALGMAALMVASALLVLSLWKVLEAQAVARDPQVSPVAIPAGRQPAEPRLLLDEPANLGKFRAEETKTLDGYGWVDERGGI